MSVQSGLRGLYIFKPSRVLFFLCIYSVLLFTWNAHHHSWGRVIKCGLRSIHCLCLVTVSHVVCFLSSLRQGKMFTAVKMNDMNTYVSVLQIQAVSWWLVSFLCLESQSVTVISQWFMPLPSGNSPHPCVSPFAVTEDTSSRHIMCLFSLHS